MKWAPRLMRLPRITKTRRRGRRFRHVRQCPFKNTNNASNHRNVNRVNLLVILIVNNRPNIRDPASENILCHFVHNRRNVLNFIKGVLLNTGNPGVRVRALSPSLLCGTVVRRARQFNGEGANYTNNATYFLYSFE